MISCLLLKKNKKIENNKKNLPSLSLPLAPKTQNHHKKETRHIFLSFFSLWTAEVVGAVAYFIDFPFLLGLLLQIFLFTCTEGKQKETSALSIPFLFFFFLFHSRVNQTLGHFQFSQHNLRSSIFIYCQILNLFFFFFFFYNLQGE